MKKTKRKCSIVLYLMIFIFLAYLEMTIKLSVTSLKSEYIFQVIAFTASYSFFAFLFVRLLPRKIFKTFILVSIILITLLYFSQDIYYRILSSFFSFDIAGDAHKATAFTSRIFKNLTYVHIMYLVPIALVTYFAIKYKKVEIPKKYFFYESTFEFLQVLVVAVLLFTTVVHTLPKKPENYSKSEYIYADYDFYDKVPSAYQTINKFGMITYFQRDIMNKFKEEPDELSIYEEIHSYGEERIDRIENPFYEGYFEGKNLILIMAESFDTFAIDPALTPNIYAMQQNSWNFTNFYSPLYYRNTADTEFMSQTGFYTSRNSPLTMEAYQDNYFPYTLPRIFSNKVLESGRSYGTYSFHNYTDYFYPRSVFHPKTLGYDEYYGAVDFGMLPEPKGVITNHIWQSDLELMEKSLDILLEKPQPFFSYILTVSGHLDYDSSNPIAKKNLDIIKDIFEQEEMQLPENNEFLYYHAANYELDLAVGYLMDTLENQGLLEDTVIMLFGDHYAYGIDREEIALYDESKSDESSILGDLRFQRVPMMIYHSDLYYKEFDQVFASIDIMPTLANLFDLEVEYELIFGKDIFSNQRRAVYFSNGSILTDDFFFDSENEEYIIYDETSEITLADAEALYGEYLYRQLINESILEIDYFWLQDQLDLD
ncbi:sulfatase-like hydrolase/transferase [Hujiaoplasma nucleasis]|uniref:Sulfatase-like hydrolase/transferase n=1 Tax=Hujiaoplasma nucleasis TaxID=2725268 RepID=A0A7L6N238_9MOLU|nr:LTA synthase family protein [Hujiaoplasma nucleasis]QLY40233.1 sulfatase-like hydrolase/transferase [Hujiaoplasma nucleasis]